jgi:hypothetical protein
MRDTFVNVKALADISDINSPDWERGLLLQLAAQSMHGWKFGSATLTYEGLTGNYVPTFSAPFHNGPARPTTHEQDTWRYFDEFDWGLLEVGKTYHFMTAIDPVKKTKKGKDIRFVLCLVGQKPPGPSPKSFSFDNNKVANQGGTGYLSYCVTENAEWLESLGVTQ